MTPAFRIALAGAWLALSPPAPALPAFPEAPSSYSLQRGLEQVLGDLGLSQAARDGRLAVALARLEDGRPPALAMVNGERMMYAASLPKIAILYGTVAAVDQGRLSLTTAQRKDLNDMVRVSCNDCSNRLLDAIGRDWLLALLQADPWRFYDREHGGGLWVGKDYAKTAAFHRDPMHGLSHGATAWQVARWYYLMFNDQLAGKAATDLAREAMRDPAINHKLVRGLQGRRVDTMYRKSGTWREHNADSALVESGPHRYIVVVMARDLRGERWIQVLAPALHDLATGERKGGG